MTSKAQLPITQLNYGDSEGRFSWILYQLGYLKCFGKEQGVVYLSEIYQNKIETIENDIHQNADDITQLSVGIEDDFEVIQNQITTNTNDISSNDNDISSLKSRTSTLEGNVIQNDYYFKYKGDGK